MPPHSPQHLLPRTNNVYNKPYSPLRSPVQRASPTKSPIARSGTKAIHRQNKVLSPRRRTPDEVSRQYANMTLEEYIASKEKRSTSTIETKTPSSMVQTADQKIRVCVRKRPLNKSEMLAKEKDIAQMSGMRTIEILEPRVKLDLTQYVEPHSFTFDNVFDSNTSNRTIYQKTTRPLVDYMFEGGKSTCFAFGQTGSGKTYTMLDPKHGLYTLAVMDIFRLLNKGRYAHLAVWVGYYEIYQGHLYDLLNKRKKLIPRDDGKGNVVIAGLKEVRVHDVDTLMEVCSFGSRERTTNRTMTNQSSSRSHAILQICLKQSTNNKPYGKLNFIDLAGSERGTDRGHNTDAKVRMEGAEINRSLLALKECIRALDQDQKHASFRGSKLTMVLRDSFIGNSKTCMIATISPNSSNSDHTLNTLRYADRIKEFRGESDSRLVNTHVEDAEAMDIEEEEEGQPRRITKEHIKIFLDQHWVEIHESEEYLKIAKEMVNDVNSAAMDSLEFYNKYRNYLTSLNSLLEKKLSVIHHLQDKIKEELCSDDE
ncbi:hypothetical protein G6F70_000370 [Rhizopus microsporus]|uniref:Kinesin-like protein n=2 Tax=Rhizopus TaxID=4842 RepID=A0A367K2I0_RHIAZ|nr:hypothetical protein G6F71_000388 [Rhizopus microsporus]RCH96370.1 Kinesin-like protein kif24 [Rhizopus azygosporus]KAG1204516.1 hypothetical protein G6F70_000370 [Rhizopus microsporus]KAG1216018.1 hypothetical protein G6F69_000445 [Rhizopus microsporus]KAG1238589.1 hypothetical protein G6F67_000282 [Rhizopus microsporus]